MNIIKQFQLGLKKTSDFLSFNIIDALKSKKINQETLDEIETILLSSDIGLEVTSQLIKKIQSSKFPNQENSNTILKLLANELELILQPRELPLLTLEDKKPTILLFIGVNGSGKTTTIGKLINTIPKSKKILVGACDTFRAAAVEQLNIWAERSNAEFIKGNEGCDAAGLAYEAIEKPACLNSSGRQYSWP